MKDSQAARLICPDSGPAATPDTVWSLDEVTAAVEELAYFVQERRPSLHNYRVAGVDPVLLRKMLLGLELVCDG